MSLNVCVVRLVSMVVYCLQLLVVCLQSSCDEHRGCVLLVVEWRRRVKCVCYLYTCAHTLNNEKKNCNCYQCCCRNEEVITYGIRAGSTCGLGFATTFVDMIRFDYTVGN
jgi:hypothetical protein